MAAPNNKDKLKIYKIVHTKLDDETVPVEDRLKFLHDLHVALSLQQDSLVAMTRWQRLAERFEKEIKEMK